MVVDGDVELEGRVHRVEGELVDPGGGLPPQELQVHLNPSDLPRMNAWKVFWSAVGCGGEAFQAVLRKFLRAARSRPSTRESW